MAVKTISLSDEAYAKLDAERAEGESFESVIERLTQTFLWERKVYQRNVWNLVSIQVF